MRNITISLVQMSMTNQVEENHEKLVSLIIEAAKQGAQIVLMPELPSRHYFCKQQNSQYFAYAETVEQCKLIQHIQKVAKEYKLVIPVSFFERLGQVCYNSVAMVDVTGEILGVYRKSHIPDGIGYMEKYYFSPGKEGFKVWKTEYVNIGCGICWDQWFPEAARSMVLDGAEILLYPTAIGSEPHLPEYDSKSHWQRVMQGHSGANIVPVIAANRVGVETDDGITTRFYGSSFITDHLGEIIEQADRNQTITLTHQINLDEVKKQRDAWGIFRDRRPDLYGRLIQA